VVDYADFVRHAREFDAVRREYGFDDGSVGIVPDIAFLVRKFELHGFRLERLEHPFYNEYFYNAAFYAPGVTAPASNAEKTSVTFDWSGFDPERSLTALGRRHPCYVDYHRRCSTRQWRLPRNRLTGCVVLLFHKPAAGASMGHGQPAA
jgi:hypothetical protein